MSIRFKAVVRHWSGHGEGGRTVHVESGYRVGDLYYATDADIKQAHEDADDLNNLLDDMGL